MLPEQGVMDRAWPAGEVGEVRPPKAAAGEQWCLGVDDPVCDQFAQSGGTSGRGLCGTDGRVGELLTRCFGGGQLQVLLGFEKSLDARLAESDVAGQPAEAEPVEPFERGNVHGMACDGASGTGTAQKSLVGHRVGIRSLCGLSHRLHPAILIAVDIRTIVCLFCHGPPTIATATSRTSMPGTSRETVRQANNDQMFELAQALAVSKSR